MNRENRNMSLPSRYPLANWRFALVFCGLLLAAAQIILPEHKALGTGGQTVIAQVIPVEGDQSSRGDSPVKGSSFSYGAAQATGEESSDHAR